MGDSGENVRRLETTQLTCPYCGLPQDQVQSVEHDPMLLEPGLRVPAHEAPAERRWIELSDGLVAVYGTCPVDGEQLCRIEHLLVCPGQRRPDLWPHLTRLRRANKLRAAELAAEANRRPEDEQLPDVG
ncbi:DUF6083 domain-containing protein [Streptomyces sp. cg28]|uniref:DUF6083 domain-containing protein n=1 Tax=Streptomyces sp. cg28 TaxID=3403457 RepID=UPI003B21229C